METIGRHRVGRRVMLRKPELRAGARWRRGAGSWMGWAEGTQRRKDNGEFLKEDCGWWRNGYQGTRAQSTVPRRPRLLVGWTRPSFNLNHYWPAALLSCRSPRPHRPFEASSSSWRVSTGPASRRKLSCSSTTSPRPATPSRAGSFQVSVAIRSRLEGSSH